MPILEWIDNGGNFYDAEFYPWHFCAYKCSNSFFLSVTVGEQEGANCVGNYATIEEAKQEADKYLLDSINCLANSAGYMLVRK